MEVVWTATGRRSVERLPLKAAAAVAELVYGSLVAEPRRVGKPLRFELEGLWVARRGDYRIIYRIDEPGDTLIIHTVAHRRDAYRRAGP